MKRSTEADWRRIIWASLATVAAMCVVVLGSIAIAGRLVDNAQGTLDEVLTENRELRGKNDCLARIDAHARRLAAERDTIVTQSLVDYATSGRPTGLVERAAAVDDYNRRIKDAGDLLTRSVQICTDNPDFRPPS